MKDIVLCLDETFQLKHKKAEVEKAIKSIEKKFEAEAFAFALNEVGGGYQFLLKGSYFNTVATHLKLNARKRLSRAALETLSIIAYRQPISRPDIEKIRGVNCVYALQKLLDKDLIEILGRSDGPGKPLLYGTSMKFMSYFGLKDIKDLPKLKELKVADNEIGEQQDLQEVVNKDDAPEVAKLDAISAQN